MSNNKEIGIIGLVVLGIVAFAYYLTLRPLRLQIKTAPKTFITDSYFLSQDDVAEMKTKIDYAEEKTNYVLEQIIELEQRIEDLEP